MGEWLEKQKAKEENIAPLDESVKDKSCRYVEFLLVAGPNLAAIAMLTPVFRGRRCPAIPNSLACFITFAVVVMINGALGFVENARRVCIDRKRATHEPFKQGDKRPIARASQIVGITTVGVWIWMCILVYPNLQYLSFDTDSLICSGGFFNAFFIATVITTAIMGLIFLFIVWEVIKHVRGGSEKVAEDEPLLQA